MNLALLSPEGVVHELFPAEGIEERLHPELVQQLVAAPVDVAPGWRRLNGAWLAPDEAPVGGASPP